MIIDTLRSAEYYFNVHPGIEAGFAFVADVIRGKLEDGEYEIDGHKVYAIVSSCSAIGRDNARLEIHKKYIDLQFCLESEEVIGWSHIDECTKTSEEYDPDKDIAFYLDSPGSWIKLAGDNFVIFFPHDAHAPLAGEGKCRKVVVKIAV